LNLPHTSMRDLAVHDHDLIVATHGRSFWVLDDISPLRQFTATLTSAEATLLKPSPAIRVSRSTGTDTPIQPDEPAGRNPPDGAVIDYFLAHDAKQPVTIEILDASGALVRRVSSADPPQFTREQIERELIPEYWIQQAQPPAASAGMHRWIWDLHYAPPRTVKRGFPISAVPNDTPQEPDGPPANPGTYRVRLRIGARTSEAALAVTADPRIKITAADFSAQFDLASRLAAALDGSTAALLEARSIRAQLKDLTSRGVGSLAAQIQSLDLHTSALIEPPKDGGASHRGLESLNGDIATLYAQVTAADAAPTTVQASQSDLLFKEWQAVQATWQGLLNDELAGLNRGLGKVSLPNLRTDLEPPRDLDFANDE